MTRKELIAQSPDAQEWFALSDDARIQASIAAKPQSVWQNLKTSRRVTINAADRFRILVTDTSGKSRTIQTHYFSYDYFPVKALTREEKIARQPGAAEWFGIAAPDRAKLLDEERSGTVWKNLDTYEVVEFRDHRAGNSEGPCTTWFDGTVIVGTSDGEAKHIPTTDFIYNYFPTTPNHDQAQHPQENAALQSNMDHDGDRRDAPASEKTEVKPFKPVKLTRKEAYKVHTRYETKVRRRDLGMDITVCGLCANTGTIKLGERVGALNEPLPACEVPCVCPNGQYAPWTTPGVPRGPL